MTKIFLSLLIILASCGAPPAKAKYGGGPFAPYGRSAATWTQGAGTPESVVAAPPGSIYSRSAGGVGTAFYVKGSGTGTTGWLSGPQIDGFYNIVGTPVTNHGTVATGSKNAIGAITTIGAFTTLTLTYSAAYPNDALCMATPLAVGTPEVVSLTAHTGSVATFSCINTTTGVAANCVDFAYYCFGR